MDKNYTNIKERILYYAKYQGIAIEKFLSTIGMTYGSFKGKAKEGSLNSDAIERILTTYKDINPFWLITGEGEMLKKEEVSSSMVSEPPTQYGDTDNRILLSMIKDKDEKIVELSIEIGRLNACITRLKEKVPNPTYTIGESELGEKKSSE